MATLNVRSLVYVVFYIINWLAFLPAILPTKAHKIKSDPILAKYSEITYAQNQSWHTTRMDSITLDSAGLAHDIAKTLQILK